MDNYKELLETLQQELGIMWCCHIGDKKEYLPLIESVWLQYAQAVEAALISEGMRAMVVHSNHTHIDPSEWCIRIDVEIGATYLYIYPTKVCSKDKYSIFSPTYTHNNLHDLVQHLKGVGSRKGQWLQGVIAGKVCRT